MTRIEKYRLDIENENKRVTKEFENPIDDIMNLILLQSNRSKRIDDNFKKALKCLK